MQLEQDTSFKQEDIKKFLSHYTYSNLTRFYASLIVAGTLSLAFTVFFNKFAEQYSCADEHHSYARDVAKWFFWGSGVFWFVGSSAAIYTLDRFNIKKDTAHKIESEWSAGMMSTVFLWGLAVQVLNWPKYIPAMLTLFSLYPVFASSYSVKNENFKRGPAKEYFDWAEDNKIKAAGFTFLEWASSSINLASTASFAIGLLINLAYDAAHENSWPYTNHVIYAMIALSAISGAGSLINQSTWKASQMLQAFVNIFYISFMIAASSFFCVEPKYLNIANFKHDGWAYMLLFGASSFLLALPAAYFARKNIYGEKKGDYSEIPTLTLNEDEEIAADKTNWLAALVGYFSCCSSNVSECCSTIPIMFNQMVSCFENCFSGIGSCFSGIKSKLFSNDADTEIDLEESTPLCCNRLNIRPV